MSLYGASIDSHRLPKVLVILHQNGSRTDNSSDANENRNWSHFRFDFIDRPADLVLVGRINLPALGIDALLLAKCDGFLGLTEIKNRNVSTGLCKGKTNSLTDISGAPYPLAGMSDGTNQ
jgi:hypothetical protein